MLLKKKILLVLFSLLFYTCNEGESSHSFITPKGPEAKFGFFSLTMRSYPYSDDSLVTCPKFKYGNMFFTGDTVGVIVSQEAGWAIIGNKEVFVKVITKTGDDETYLCDPRYWPCETRITGYVIYRAIISYRSYSVDSNYSPIPGDGLLEIIPGVDSLFATYQSFSTGKILSDTAVIQ